jgi:hypothetical protein
VAAPPDAADPLEGMETMLGQTPESAQARRPGTHRAGVGGERQGVLADRRVTVLHRALPNEYWDDLGLLGLRETWYRLKTTT